MNQTLESTILKNIQETRQAISDEAKKWQQQKEVALVAVSKKQPEERIDAALNAGHRVFGENRVQEAEERWQKRREQYPDLELHLIGPLQTNKVKQAVALFDVIETIDRPKLAKAIADELERTGEKRECYIQVNTGEEEQKSGVLPNEFPALLKLCQDELKLPITGVMCIPPQDEESSLHFALLKKMANENGLPNVSMGMSSDYIDAVALGATHVRVGTGIFGERE